MGMDSPSSMLNSRIYPVAPSTASQLNNTTSGAVNTAVKFLGPPSAANLPIVLHEREKTISKTNNRLMVFGFIIYSPLFIYNITILEVKSNKSSDVCENNHNNICC